ncbi:hypothetical protein [Heliophilum fasciatum]|uniref:Uncharacterized protein n=1 Tax=Heliophilum fasciatum TaxID=35700 RepID=A0A4R2RCT5_9FIRM|nr:hypothetical protein [Heliophilum fasciatum]MCW2279127.1 hypothetical protein [Heliophilum fasciatum]TCP61212.1 hypothetical protein EDD73_1304 [Heliophilum fasciatum]
MIHVEPVPEPTDFDQQCRQRGQRWLAEHPHAKRPQDFWTPFKSYLADGFGDLCAYSAMYEPVGTVDHFFSCKNRLELAYEWSNYRYSAAWINSSKNTADGMILDPFEIGDNWFEIILPSLQLVVSRGVPEDMQEIAQYTLRRLHLVDDERVIRQRREWYRMYQQGRIDLEGLHEKAPLIARAIEKQRLQENHT